MPESIKNIKSRISATLKTGQITHAMELVSATKIRKFEEKSKDAKYFLKNYSDAISNIEFDVDNGLFKQRLLKKRGYLLITSDKGLAGSYNSSLLKMFFEEVKKDQTTIPVIYVIGRIGSEILNSQRFKIHFQKIGIGDDIHITSFYSLTNQIINDFQNEVIDSLTVFTSDYINLMLQIPTKIELLPLNLELLKSSYETVSEPLENSYIDIDINSSERELLLQDYLKITIYGFNVIAKAAEHASRKVSMKSATDNADEIAKDLKLYYNKLRQEKITTELSEIVAGSMS